MAPAVPTVAESGYPGFEVGSHFVMLAPAGVRNWLRSCWSNTACSHLVARLCGQIPRADIRVGSNAAEAREFLRGDTALWARIAKDANLRVD